MAQRLRATWLSDALVLTLLVFGTAYCYAPLRHFAFVHLDDPTYVTDNPHVCGGLSWNATCWALTTFSAGNWHPLAWLSHQADVTCFGLDSGAHHLTSLLWHVAAAVTLFLALRCLTGKIWPSGIVALLFAWHPVHVESVAWISERKDVISAFCAAATLLTYGAWIRRPHVANYLLLVGCFALSLMAKPMLVTGPAVLLLLDYWPLGRLFTSAASRGPALLARFLEKLPLVVLSVASAALTLAAQHRAGAVAAVHELSLTDRLAHAVVSYVVYLRQAFWPAGLAVFYPYPAAGHAWPSVAGAGLLLAGLTAVALLARRHAPALFVGWLWFVGMLVPVIGLVQVGSQAHADRYLYLPLVGLSLAVVFGLPDLLRNAERFIPARHLRTVVVLLTVVLLSAAALATRRQVMFWQNSDTLFSRAIAIGSDHPLIRTNLGAYWLERNEPQRAAEQFQHALALDPRDTAARVGWAMARAALGDPAAARQAATVLSDAGQLLPSAANNLAWLLATAPHAEDRDPRAAIRFAHSAVERQPDRPEFADTLAAAWAASGDFARAASIAEAAAHQAQQAGNASLASEITARAAAYRRGTWDTSP